MRLRARRVDLVDWDAISEILEEIQVVLTQSGDTDTRPIVYLQEGIASRRRFAVLTVLTSAEMWNRADSFFGRTLSDEALDRRFRRAQIRLVNELKPAG